MRQGRGAPPYPALDSAPLSLLPVVGLVSRSRGRRRDREAHSPGCGCAQCRRSGELELGITLHDGSAVLEDPDSMEDEDKPYFWNRGRALNADD